jgi:SAM-dependent methyltransferase
MVEDSTHMNREAAGRSGKEIIEKQQRRFDDEYVEYERRHSHQRAQQYRDRFFRERLFSFPLEGAAALDAMCATGIDTPFLRRNGAVVTGLDISPECCRVFTERFGSPCVERSMHDTGFDEGSFDVVYIGGGLHHINHLIPDCVREVHRILKPGGYFCAVEPNGDDWSDRLRRMWYSSDKRFEDEERAISYKKELRPLLEIGFDEEDYFTAGNFAYLTLQQSSTLRTPDFVLSKLGGALMTFESIVSFVPLVPRLFFGCRWQKRPGAGMVS